MWVSSAGLSGNHNNNSITYAVTLSRLYDYNFSMNKLKHRNDSVVTPPMFVIIIMIRLGKEQITDKINVTAEGAQKGY